MMARYGFIITGKTAGIYTKMLAVCTTEKYITSDFYYLISFLKNFIFTAVLSSQKNWKESIELSQASPVPTHA